jgi:hypothetical protein
MGTLADLLGLQLLVSAVCPHAPRVLFRAVQPCTVMLRPGKGRIVDHINGDTLDNRRENLQVLTPGQNLMKKRGREHPGVALTRGGKFRFRSPDGRYRQTASLETARRGADQTRRAAGIKGMPLNFPEVGEHYWDGRLRTE